MSNRAPCGALFPTRHPYASLLTGRRALNPKRLRWFVFDAKVERLAPIRSFALFAGGWVAIAMAPARADDEQAHRQPMPEPLLAETITDIDGREAGELELEVNALTWRALRGGAHKWQASFEGEFLATSRLGLRVEALYQRTVIASVDTDGASPIGVTGGVSWKLLHDFRHDLHAQAEVGFRYPNEMAAAVEPEDSALPLVADLRAGWRRGLVTLRTSVGVEAGGNVAHAPVRGSIGILAPLGPSERYGFWGFEFEVDAARQAPALLALNLVPNLEPLRLPFRLGLAVPWSVGGRDTEPSLGIFVRLFVESGREIAYGETGRAE